MKRLFIILVATLALGVAAQAQSTFRKGATVGSITLGLSDGIFSPDNTLILPPLSFALDHSIAGGLFDGNGSFGLGAFFGTSISQKSFVTSSRFLMGPQASLHYQFVSKLDTYFSLMLGLNLEHYSWTDDGIRYRRNKSRIGWGAHIGTRYYLSPRWAAMMELGYGISLFSIGMSYHF